ncbi:uncharacterized protein PAC_06608 [Phialocephala subalpina]|uniref:Uncharacterized protein n=1 Tax=Phialocephala subalpina TaxID=576137 RepID=A0A1L7WVC1_9HELO|nr:uncharacterized protein PAC_06608 [Phialocephala subalpina]
MISKIFIIASCHLLLSSVLPLILDLSLTIELPRLNPSPVRSLAPKGITFDLALAPANSSAGDRYLVSTELTNAANLPTISLLLSTTTSESLASSRKAAGTSSTVAYGAGMARATVTECQGSTAVLYAAPAASTEMGSSKVNIGTQLTGSALIIKISSALQPMCPTPTTSGAWAECFTDAVTLAMSWLNSDERPEHGALTLKVTDAQYNSTGFCDLFIEMIATAANSSASGDNCKLLGWILPVAYTLKERCAPDQCNTTPTQKGSNLFCNMEGFLDTQFYNGVQETARMWLENGLGFDLRELGDFPAKGRSTS